MIFLSFFAETHTTITTEGKSFKLSTYFVHKFWDDKKENTSIVL